MFSKNKTPAYHQKTATIIRGGVKHYSYHLLEKRRKPVDQSREQTGQSKRRRRNFKPTRLSGDLLWAVGLFCLVVIGGSFAQKTLFHHDKKNSVSKIGGFNKQRFPLNEPDSLWVIVNKRYALPADYKPPNLRTPATPLLLSADDEEMSLAVPGASAFENLVRAAKDDGVQLVLASGFRSYDRQYQVHQYAASHLSENKNENLESKPGTNEHQTGLAVDVTRSDNKCAMQVCFGKLPEGVWLSSHAHEYGFIVHFQADKESVTGMKYQPWHIRYVGADLARELHRVNQTMEEFLGS